MPSHINTNIYPAWWTTDTPYKNNQNDEVKEEYMPRSRSKTRENFKSEKTEVFFNNTGGRLDNQTIKTRSKSTSRLKTAARSKSKIKYIPIKLSDPEQDCLMNEKIRNAESKIRPHVVYDKEMFTQMKQQQENLNSTLPPEWKYEGNNSKTNSSYSKNRSRATTPDKTKTQPKINYAISYDRNFKPETIKEKSKERQQYKSKTNSVVESRRNSERPPLRNEETIKKETHLSQIHNSQTNTIPRMSIKESSVKDINETAEFERRGSKQEHLNNIYMGDSQGKLYEDVSFKKERTDRIDTKSEEPLLSSYAPSERTKSKQKANLIIFLDFFQREFSKENFSYSSSSKREDGGMNILTSNNSQNFSGYNSNLAFSGENVNSQGGFNNFR
jgi:hypothetical protein